MTQTLESDGSTAVDDRTHQAMLTKQQLATRLGISVRHLENLVRRGVIPRPVSLGRCVRFWDGQIQSWLAQGCPRAATTVDPPDFPEGPEPSVAAAVSILSPTS